MTRPPSPDPTTDTQHTREEERICIELVPEMLEPVDVLARHYGWTREKALMQMVDDWATTFAWQDLSQ